MDQNFAVSSARASGGVQLRPVCPDDVQFVDAAAARLFSLEGPGIYTRAEALEGTRRVLQAAIAEMRDDALFTIAYAEQGERVGFVYAVTVRSFFTAEPHAHISEIVALHERRGIGRALMEAAEAWSHERGYRIVTLNVMHANAGARAFYERLGYALELHRYSKLLGPP